jgi:hypothetical protein
MRDNCLKNNEEANCFAFVEAHLKCIELRKIASAIQQEALKETILSSKPDSIAL